LEPALRLWFDAQLFEDVTLSTSVEGGSGAPREHWRQVPGGAASGRDPIYTSLYNCRIIYI